MQGSQLKQVAGFGPYGHQSGAISLAPCGSTELSPLQPRIPQCPSVTCGIRLKARGQTPKPLGYTQGPLRTAPVVAPQGVLRPLHPTRRWEKSRALASCHCNLRVVTTPEALRHPRPTETSEQFPLPRLLSTLGPLQWPRPTDTSGVFS